MNPTPTPDHATASKSTDSETTADRRPVPLTALRPGDRGRMHGSSLAPQDRDLLDALGLASQSSLRLAKAGNPWIVQVRATRIGLAEAVARSILVIPEPLK